MSTRPHRPVRPQTKEEPQEDPRRLPHSWRRKFHHAFRGFKCGIRGQSSFAVHFFVAAMVLAAGVTLGLTLNRWLVVLMCITLVLTAEMFNSALEHLARAVNDSYDPHLRDALDIGSAAVLVTAVGASLVGSLIFGLRLLELLGIDLWSWVQWLNPMSS